MAEAAPEPELPPEPEPPKHSERYTWAMLLARIYDVLPLLCQRCGQAMGLVGFITESTEIRRILSHVGVLVRAPGLSPARAPPQGEFTGIGALEKRATFRTWTSTSAGSIPRSLGRGLPDAAGAEPVRFGRFVRWGSALARLARGRPRSPSTVLPGQIESGYTFDTVSPQRYAESACKASG